MNKFLYADEHDIKLWVEAIKLSSNVLLKKSLPCTDKDWYEKVLDTLERAKLIYSNQEHEVAARLFYYLIKDHNFVDGNKRTGIIITYLFLIMNGYTVTSPIKIKALAKKVARSHGSSRQDKWIEKITAQLEAITIIY